MFTRYYLFLLIVISACDSDFFPEGIYDYQVERLLSSGDEKVWLMQVDSDLCQDSTKLYIQFLASSSDDSLTIFELISNSNCTGFDTTLVGNADASSFDGSFIFTDSLNFANGNFWIIKSITSKSLSLEVDNVISGYSF